MGSRTTLPAPQPVLKWPGGKRQVLPQLLPHLRQMLVDGRSYCELMAGGGAVFFALAAEGLLDGREVVLADASHALIGTYKALAAHAVEVSAELEELARCYNELRREAQEPFFQSVLADLNMRLIDPRIEGGRGLASVEAAAQFLFVNRAGFNGLWRVSRSGRCNTSFGKKRVVRVPSLLQLVAAGQALAMAQLLVAPFSFTLMQIDPTSAVFADPPYTSLLDEVKLKGGFTGYTKDGFKPADQRLLTSLLSRHPGPVLLTNGNAEGTEEAYRTAGFDVEVVGERRAINRDGSDRGPVGCVVARKSAC